MQLAAVLQEIDKLLAGGPGSGCNGPNCGRPGGALKFPKLYDEQSAREAPIHPTWIKHRNWKQQAYGGVVVNAKGQFLLRHPTGSFDGYVWTFPKGKMDHSAEHPLDVAQREIEQETGYKAAMFGRLPGTYTTASGSHSSFFMMRPKGNDAAKMDNETSKLRWADYATARAMISKTANSSGRKRDLAILDRAQRYLEKHVYSKG